MKRKYIWGIILLCVALIVIIPVLYRAVCIFTFIHIDRWSCKINFEKYEQELEITKNYVSTLHPEEDGYYLAVSVQKDEILVFDSVAQDYIKTPDDLTMAIGTINRVITEHTSSEHVIMVKEGQIIFTCCGSYVLVYSPNGTPTNLPLRECDRIAIQEAGNGWYHVTAIDNIDLWEIVQL